MSGHLTGLCLYIPTQKMKEENFSPSPEFGPWSPGCKTVTYELPCGGKDIQNGERCLKTVLHN